MLWQAKVRRDWLQGFRLGLSVITWRDVLGPGRRAALARFDREYLATCHVFGTDITTSLAVPASRPSPASRLARSCRRLSFGRDSL